MTMLTTVQQFCRRTGLDVPATVSGSTDDQVIQIMALLSEEGIDLAARGDWQEITFEATHTTIAAEDQGAISSIATNGFDHFKLDCFYDRTAGLPMAVVDGQDWAALKATSSSGPRYRVRVRGGKLLVNPTPSAGDTWAFEYISKNWILDDDGTTYKQYLTEDADTILLPEHIVLAGLRWRWKKEKGLDYAEDFSSYEKLVSKALGHNGLKKVLNQAGENGAKPGVFVQNGNWSIP